LSALGACTPETSPQQNKRPNILFCIADDWSWGYAGVYGNAGLQTPTFDRVAREGTLFRNAFCASPSCTPSRGAILTGRPIHQLEEGGNLWSYLPKRFDVFPDLLEKAGYHVGLTGKGWGPGDFRAGGRTRNPAGPSFKTFQEFLKARPAGKPFYFWFGTEDPHRPYEKGAGGRAGMKPEHVKIPPFWPDTPEIRSDILDYCFEVQRMDRDVGEVIKALEATGELDNTLIIFTSDNGMPFPRAKANLYDAGTRMPLAMRWPARIKSGQIIDVFVNLYELAPTVLEAAGVKPPSQMAGRSLLPLVAGEKQDGRDMVFLERERHANVRKSDLSYPIRAVRTSDFLYLRNLRPDRWPGGDPEMWKAVGEFGDCDPSPSKDFILAHRSDPGVSHSFQLCFGKRHAEELYDLSNDPGQTNNVAAKPEYAEAQKKLRRVLDDWMTETGDPRLKPEDDRWDKFPYYGNTQGEPAPFQQARR
jgi:arylsulfatase A-like enzyme